MVTPDPDPAGLHPASVAGEHLLDHVPVTHADHAGQHDGASKPLQGNQEAKAGGGEGGQPAAAAAAAERPRPEGATASVARRVLQDLQLSVAGAAQEIQKVGGMGYEDHGYMHY
jgi:hypothetical protein